jgi:hypothetical protein
MHLIRADEQLSREASLAAEFEPTIGIDEWEGST